MTTSKINKKSSNVRNVNRFRGYYADDVSCPLCLHYRNKKIGFGLDVCLYEDERRDGVANGRVSRKHGSDTKWDG